MSDNTPADASLPDKRSPISEDPAESSQESQTAKPVINSDSAGQNLSQTKNPNNTSSTTSSPLSNSASSVSPGGNQKAVNVNVAATISPLQKQKLITAKASKTPAYSSNFKSADILPNQTLYCSNLNDKIRRPELCVLLYELFIPYGDILDISIRKGIKHRGQAFVVLTDIQSACSALRECRNRVFCGKPIHLNYALKKSEVILRLDPNYRPKWRDLQTRVPYSGSSGKDSHFTIFVENIPHDSSKEALTTLFSQYPGMSDCRIVEGRNVAFIDYETEAQAEVVLQGLQGFNMASKSPLKISWATTATKDSKTHIGPQVPAS